MRPSVFGILFANATPNVVARMAALQPYTFTPSFATFAASTQRHRTRAQSSLMWYTFP